MVQGTALLGGVGLLLDEGGQDVYIGAPDSTQPFMAGILFEHSSQGFACDGGIGILIDRGAASDQYLNGPAGRTNGASVTQADTACFAAPGVGIFCDDG
jgi:hypothetical protein